MSTPSNTALAYAELAPHALHIAILTGKKIVAWRCFRPDSKAEIAAFVAEHKLSSLAQASIVGDRVFLHLSDASESASTRQPDAIQAHLKTLSHGFGGAVDGVVCDAKTGRAIEPFGSAPWLLTSFDSSAFGALRGSLGEMGLAPAGITAGAPAHVGAVAASLKEGQIAAVIIPGNDDAWMVWVSDQGVLAASAIPFGFNQIYEAVQQGLGLKFRAAAGKLFFNDTYDFTEAAAKISELLAPVLRQALAARPAAFLHIAGLPAGQAWFTNGLGLALGLAPSKFTGTNVAAGLGLDAGGADIPFAAAGVLQLAAAAASPAPWIQPTLDTIASDALAKSKSPELALPANRTLASTAAPIKPATATALKPAAAPKPAPKPAIKPVPKAMPAPVLAVAVNESRDESPAPSAKRSKAAVFIGVGAVVVAAVVSLAFHFRSPASQRIAKPEPAVEPAAPTTTPVPATPVPATPAKQPAPPKIDAVPSPAPVKIPEPAVVKSTTEVLAPGAREFSNASYRFKISDKGFIQSLATVRDDVLVESAGGTNLQGSYIGTDGRRKWFNVGGIDDIGYVATVSKSIRDGQTVFETVVQHPRFSLEQTFTCLPNSVKVSAKLTPINLRDPRGAIVAVNSVRLAPVALNPAMRMRAQENNFIYSMKPATLRLQFDSTAWARDGIGGLQTIVAGENGVAFYLTDSAGKSGTSVTYEIHLGSTSN